MTNKVFLLRDNQFQNLYGKRERGDIACTVLYLSFYLFSFPFVC